TAHLGVIARTAEWQTALAGFPLDVEITHPRGMLVSRTHMTVSAAGPDEIAYTSQAGGPTGTYEATAYLTKTDKRSELLGGRSFKEQEFQPDRFKLQL